MNKEEIIEMAYKAGGYSPEKYPDEWRLDVDDLSRFAELVAEKEHEKCAKIADEWSIAYPHPSKVIAELIRKRGKNE